MGGASGYIISRLPPHLRFLLFSDEDPSLLTLLWRRDLPLKRLSSQIRTSCSDQLGDSVIPSRYPVGSKKALLEEQISAQRCCKCCAVIVRRARIPCTLMTLTLSVWHAVVDKVHRSSTWVKVQIRIIKYYSSKSKSTAFSILLEWKYKSTQFFTQSKKVLIYRFI